MLAAASWLSFGGLGGRSFAKSGDAPLGASGDDAGETGEIKGSTVGCLRSSLRYSGVGGRWTAGAPGKPAFALEVLDTDSER